MDGQPVDTNTIVQPPTDTTQDSICDKPDIANMEDKSEINIENIQQIIDEAKPMDDAHYENLNHIRQKYIIYMNNNYKDKENKNNTPENNKTLINELDNEVNIFNKKFNEFFKADGGSYIKSGKILYDEKKNEFYKERFLGRREIKDITYIIDHIAKYKAIKHVYLTTDYCKHIQTLSRETMNQVKKRLEEYLFTNSIIAQGILNRVDNMANNIIRTATLGTVQNAVRLTRGGNKRKTKKKPHRKKMRKTRSTTKSRSNIKKSKK